MSKVSTATPIEAAAMRRRIDPPAERGPVIESEAPGPDADISLPPPPRPSRTPRRQVAPTRRRNLTTGRPRRARRRRKTDVDVGPWGFRLDDRTAFSGRVDPSAHRSGLDRCRRAYFAHGEPALLRLPGQLRAPAETGSDDGARGGGGQPGGD